MLKERSLISFDWALKRRAFHPLSPASGGKANFGILEGFLSVLLGRDITVRQILKAKGYPAALIAEVTGLTIEEVEALEC